MNSIKIITSSFDNLRQLKSENFLSFSIVGKVYGDYYEKDKIQRIIGINTFRLKDHIAAEDYLACYYLYKQNLNRLGFDRIYNEIETKSRKNGFKKIALCGYGRENDFCFRHIVSDFFLRNGHYVKDIERKINISEQSKYWKTDIYKINGHFNMSHNEVGLFLENYSWIFAKTMPKNPHCYTLRKDCTNHLEFLKVATHIRYYGKLEEFQGLLYRVFYFGKYKYWTCPCDLKNEDVDLINRKPKLQS